MTITTQEQAAVTAAIDVLRNERTAKFLVEAIFRDHRTIQQLVLRGVLAIVEEGAAAYERKAYDARNEASLRFCCETYGGMPPLPARFPYI